MSSHGLSAIPHAVDVIAVLWHYYFPKEAFNPADPRLGSIAILLEVFDSALEYVLSRLDQRRGILRLQAPYILSKVPFEDFRGILVTQPNEVLGCMVRSIVTWSSFFMAMLMFVQPTATGSRRKPSPSNTRVLSAPATNIYSTFRLIPRHPIL